MTAPAHTPAPIAVRGIVNRFGDHVVHDGLDLEVRPGEVLSVVGGSGSGKTVLLKVLLGAGAVTTGGKMLPEKWTRPVIDTVILPAHARISPDDDDDDDDDIIGP